MSRHSTNPWVVLVLICLAQFMVVLDATIVNVALPPIQSALGFSAASLQWVINAYTLVFAGFLLLGGRAGDLLGRKRLFLIGLVIFTVGLVPERNLFELGDADRLSRASGPRRGAHFAGRALDHLDDLRRGQGARPGARGLGGDRDRRLGGRPRARRRADSGVFVALDLLRQRSGRHLRLLRSVAARAGVEGRARAQGLRPRRRRHRDRRPDARSCTASSTRRSTAGARLCRSSRSSSRRRFSSGSSSSSSARREPLVRLSIFRVRSLTTANLSMFLAFSGMFAMFFFNSQYIQDVLGLRTAEGRPLVPAVHGRDHDLRRARVRLRAADRRAAGHGHGHGAHDSGAAPLCPDACQRVVRNRRPAGNDPGLARDGRDLHAADARGDDGPEERRPGARVRALQHVAAGRRCAWAGDPVHIAASTRATRTRCQMSCTAASTPSAAPQSSSR